ncbi:hypothetical protein GGR95_003406 [Sulfitobacter undariae]|uniref:DUF4258 domain-containing protein n=1 Tax=Sulfitobacter undariae TaxID=1563671 RepID=A0A7W6EAQ7_9RHOB|nr:hypothetical protein [Sulfitobacter undariae]MBB3995742.1 hypothetical protein [Sulfitobacter undariae]
MRITAHADARMNQRGINKKHLGLVMDHGEHTGDKMVLSAKAARQRMVALKQEIKSLEEVAKKGGIAFVLDGVHVITAYRANSFSAAAAKKVRG